MQFAIFALIIAQSLCLQHEVAELQDLINFIHHIGQNYIMNLMVRMH